MLQCEYHGQNQSKKNIKWAIEQLKGMADNVADLADGLDVDALLENRRALSQFSKLYDKVSEAEMMLEDMWLL